MKVRMRVEGGQQLAQRLSQLPTRTSNAMLRSALRTTAAVPIQAQASAKAPRAPGAPDLAQHIVISDGSSRGGAVAVVVGPSSEARTDQPSRSYDKQGLYVEYGTSDTPAQPFLRPAFDLEAPRAIGAFAAAVWAALSKATGGSRGSSSGGGLL